MPEDRVVAVFPLPDVVFVPRTILPLHVFEMRDRAMMKDALAADHRLAVALLRPGWQADYQRSPAFHEVATVGRIDALEMTRDGRYHFRLVGETRVKLGEVVQETPYRLVRYEPFPEAPIDDSDPDIQRAKLDLLASHGCLVRELTSREGPGLVLDDAIPFEAAVNGACAGLPAEPQVRQHLLETSDLLERYARAAELLDEVLQRVLHLKSLRSRDEGDSGIN
jgi:Lon protease-like protein